MLLGTYKKILDAIPQGVFVFDDKLRVKFTNAAFKRSFGEQAKGTGSLAKTLGCQKSDVCGNSAACEFCAFFRAMKSAIAERTEKVETLNTTVRRADRTDSLSIRIRVLP